MDSSISSRRVFAQQYASICYSGIGIFVVPSTLDQPGTGEFHYIVEVFGTKHGLVRIMDTWISSRDVPGQQ